MLAWYVQIVCPGASQRHSAGPDMYETRADGSLRFQHLLACPQVTGVWQVQHHRQGLCKARTP